MTIAEIQTELERLKDYITSTEKHTLERLKLEVQKLERAAEHEPASLPLPTPEPEPALPVLPKDRRAEERDPGEMDQRLAEKLKLTPPVK